MYPVTIECANHGDVQILIHRCFQVVSSVHSTPVEVQWRWIDHVPDEYLELEITDEEINDEITDEEINDDEINDDEIPLVN